VQPQRSWQKSRMIQRVPAAPGQQQPLLPSDAVVKYKSVSKRLMNTEEQPRSKPSDLLLTHYSWSVTSCLVQC
jgi:hypothetical protein